MSKANETSQSMFLSLNLITGRCSLYVHKKSVSFNTVVQYYMTKCT